MARVVRPGGRVVVLEITPRPAPAVALLRAVVRPHRARPRRAGRGRWVACRAPGQLGRGPDDRRRLHLPAQLGEALPRPDALAARAGAGRAGGIRYLITAGGIVAIHAGHRSRAERVSGRRERGERSPASADGLDAIMRARRRAAARADGCAPSAISSEVTARPARRSRARQRDRRGRRQAAAAAAGGAGGRVRRRAPRERRTARSAWCARRWRSSWCTRRRSCTTI